MDVIKTRTVTDWQPYSGSASFNLTSSCLNENEDDYQLARMFSKSLQEISKEYVKEDETATVNPNALITAIDDCVRSAHSLIDWPGDRTRDKQYIDNTDIVYLYCYIFPCYEITYKYKDTSYKIEGTAIGLPNEKHTVPQDSDSISETDIEHEKSNEINKAKEAFKANKVLIIIAVIGAVIGLYGLGNIGRPASGYLVCLPLGFSVIAVCLLSLLIIHLVVKNKIAKINEEKLAEIRKLRDEKIINLIEKLKELNLPELTEDEKKMMFPFAQNIANIDNSTSKSLKSHSLYKNSSELPNFAYKKTDNKENNPDNILNNCKIFLILGFCLMIQTLGIIGIVLGSLNLAKLKKLEQSKKVKKYKTISIVLLTISILLPIAYIIFIVIFPLYQ